MLMLLRQQGRDICTFWALQKAARTGDLELTGGGACVGEVRQHGQQV